MTGVGEIIAKEALKRGLVLLVDTKGTIRYFPPRNMNEKFLRLLNGHGTKVKYWLITDAITIE